MKIFSNYTLKGLNLVNRIVMAPMYTQYNITSGKAVEYYSKRAKGGAGLIIVENTSSDLFEDNEFRDGLIKLSDSIHKHNTKAFIQLSVSPYKLFKDRNNFGESNPVNEFTTEEIGYCIKSMQDAAVDCYVSGFDGIEIHGAHGYFISSFLNPHKNKRPDKYGGNIENRMRFALECVSAVRSKAPDDFVISYRISAREFTPDETPLEDTIRFCKELESAGVDVIHASAGTGNSDGEQVTPSAKAPFSVYSDLAARVKENVSIPVISAGKNHDISICESLLKNNKTDLIAVGRPLIADCDWVNKMKQKQNDEIVKCLYCNTCIKNISQGKELRCRVNTEFQKSSSTTDNKTRE